jgi:hypothetical protein
MKRNNQEQLNGHKRVNSPDNNSGDSNVTTNNLQNTQGLESQSLQSGNNGGSTNDISTSSTSNISQNAPSTSTDENIGDTISNAVKRECNRFVEREQSEDYPKANESRFKLRSWRDNLLEKLSKAEDRYPDDDPRTEHLRGQLVKSDGYLRAAGLDAVIDDSDYPAALNASLQPGFDGDDDLGGDC